MRLLLSTSEIRGCTVDASAGVVAVVGKGGIGTVHVLCAFAGLLSENWQGWFC